MISINSLLAGTGCQLPQLDDPQHFGQDLVDPPVRGVDLHGIGGTI
jgi:hypothetical protein